MKAGAKSNRVSEAGVKSASPHPAEGVPEATSAIEKVKG
jgi:hypothetical protein